MMSTFNDTNDLTRRFSDGNAIRNYPEALRNLPYCVWKLEKAAKERITKVPYNPRNGYHASVNQPATFADLETALGAMNREGYNGVGLRVSGRIGCIDIDNSVTDEGIPSANAEAALRMLPEAFAELSPSGHGLHLYFLVPEDFRFDRDDYYINSQKKGMEIYLPDLTQRFMTVTGRMFREGTLQITGDQLKTFCETFMRKAQTNKAARATPPEGGSVLSDEEVLRRCREGYGGKTFEQYYSGDWHRYSDVNWSHSEADLSVCSRLAFFTRGDREQMDRLFRKSGLMRDKWDQARGESTYGQITINRAIQGCSAFYEPKRQAADASESADSDQRDPLEVLDEWLARDLSQEELLSERFLYLALQAQEKDLLRYIRVKEKIRKNKIGIKPFEEQLKQLKIALRESEMQTIRKIRLDDFESGDYNIPTVWIVDGNGIRYQEISAGRIQEVPVSPEPVLITGKLIDMDDRLEKLEVTFRRDGKYISCTGPRSDFMNKLSIIRYADYGLPVYSGNASLMTKYLAELEGVNSKTIPVRRSIKRAGWFDKEFYPYGMREDVQCQQDEPGSANLIEALHTNGQEEVWMELAGQTRAYPFARCILAASFAAPLIRLLSHRIIFLHVWYESRSGKTAVVKLALSVWGDPEKLMGTYHGTHYGLEQRCATLHNLPVVLDEVQSLNERRMSASELIYDLGNGIGKTQGKPGSGIRATGTWATCILSTGEQPMSMDNSMDGVNTRLMELNACPLMDQDGNIDDALARRLHTETSSHYGFAGEKLIHFLQREIIGDQQTAKNPPRLKEDMQMIQEALGKAVPERARNNPHLTNMAVLCLADYYASRVVFGEDADQALAEAVGMGARVLKIIEDDRPMETINAAWEYIIEWIASNKNQFMEYSGGSLIKNGRDPIYGIITQDRVYVIVKQMNEVLEEGGFSSRKCVKGFQREEYIDSAMDAKGNMRSQILKRIGGISTRVYALRRSRMEEMPREFTTTDEPLPEQMKMDTMT